MTGWPATRTSAFGTCLVSGSNRVPFPASGMMACTSRPSVAVFEAHHVVDFGRRGFEQVCGQYGFELVDQLRHEVKCLAAPEPALDQRIALLEPQDDLAGED